MECPLLSFQNLSSMFLQSSFSQPSFLFYGDSVMKLCEGTQQGDHESLASFPDSIQDLIDSLESKIYLWYLDDGNLSGLDRGGNNV